jgi:hypothetical protein
MNSMQYTITAQSRSQPDSSDFIITLSRRQSHDSINAHVSTAPPPYPTPPLTYNLVPDLSILKGDMSLPAPRSALFIKSQSPSPPLPSYCSTANRPVRLPLESDSMSAMGIGRVGKNALLHTHKQAHSHTNTLTHTHTHTRTNINTQHAHANTHIHTHTHTHNTHTHTHTHTKTHIHIHKCTHAHLQTHTHSHT